MTESGIQANKFKFYKSLVTAILLYGCETLALLVDCEKKDQGFRNQLPEETSPCLLPGAQDQRLGAEQDQLPRGPARTSPGNCQETEICMVRAYYTPRQPLQNHPSMHFSGWATLIGSGMLDVQHQRVDIPAHARCAHKGLLQKRLEEDLWIIIPHAPPPHPPPPRRPKWPRDLTKLN